MVIGFQIRKLHRGAESAPPPAVLDSKKPGLFRVNNEIMKEHKAEKRFIDLNSAMQQYFLVTGRQLEPLPPKPVLSDFYVPSEDHHNRELVFITLSMVGIGAFLWYSDK